MQAVLNFRVGFLEWFQVGESGVGESWRFLDSVVWHWTSGAELRGALSKLAKLLLPLARPLHLCPILESGNHGI